LFYDVAFVLRKSRSQKKGRAEFDAEDVIDRSSPYKRTAEGSSAAKKPHNGETRRFSRRVSTLFLCGVKFK